ncbi:MAG: PAS domain-containing protein [Desulfobacteraceae bacterium]|jgi:PAS domain S-box-containing protein
MKKENTYEQCFHASGNGILVTDKNGLIIAINKQAERIFDIHGSQVNGGMITDFLPIMGKEVLECLRTKKTKLGIHLHEQKVEHVLDISIIDKNSVVLGAVCTFQEMSQFEFSARMNSLPEN